MMLTTSLQLCRQHEACGWEDESRQYGLLARWCRERGIGDTDPIPLLALLDEVNGEGWKALDNTLWALRAVPAEQEEERDRVARLLACDYAAHVERMYRSEHLDDDRVRRCIKVAAAKASAKGVAAWDAAWDAAWVAVGAAAAANRGRPATAGKVAEREWQTDRLREYLRGEVE